MRIYVCDVCASAAAGVGAVFCNSYPSCCASCRPAPAADRVRNHAPAGAAPNTRCEHVLVRAFACVCACVCAPARLTSVRPVSATGGVPVAVMIRRCLRCAGQPPSRRSRCVPGVTLAQSVGLNVCVRACVRPCIVKRSVHVWRQRTLPHQRGLGFGAHACGRCPVSVFGPDFLRCAECGFTLRERLLLSRRRIRLCAPAAPSMYVRSCVSPGWRRPGKPVRTSCSAQ
jgi:hypothetical protein